MAPGTTEDDARSDASINRPDWEKWDEIDYRRAYEKEEQRIELKKESERDARDREEYYARMASDSYSPPLPSSSAVRVGRRTETCAMLFVLWFLSGCICWGLIMALGD